MTSTFGWLDQDDSQRAAMNEVIKLFQDESSVDELGIGAIRDSFSNTFFPGTSVLHTRARYVLFIPWILSDVTRRGHPLDRAREELRSQEVRLIRSLLKGGMQSGVIGSQAQDQLKTMPSQVYWPALQTLGVVTWDVSIQSHLRRSSLHARAAGEVIEGDVDDALGADLGVDKHLPPPPERWLDSTTFDLREAEASYLQDVIARLPGAPLFSWLATRPGDAASDHPWTIPAVSELPDRLAGAVDHARRLHHAWHGAPTLYNLLLAELADRDDLVEDYRDELAAWTDELHDHRVFASWDRPAFWATVRAQNPRLRTATQTFVQRWLELAEGGEADGQAARRLVAERELRLKGRRSRIQHAQARETWTPGAGMGRLGYRWGIARSFLADIHAGLDGQDVA